MTGGRRAPPFLCCTLSDLADRLSPFPAVLLLPAIPAAYPRCRGRSRPGPARGHRPAASPETEVASDEHALDLGGALADLEDLGVAVEASDRRLVHVAVAAEDLRGLAGVDHRGLGCDQLRNGRFVLEGHTCDGSVGRIAVGESRDVGARLHVGNFELQRLGVPELAPERLALAEVANAFIDAALRQADRERGDRDPALVEDGQELCVAASFFA